MFNESGCTQNKWVLQLNGFDLSYKTGSITYGGAANRRWLDITKQQRVIICIKISYHLKKVIYAIHTYSIITGVSEQNTPLWIKIELI